MKRAIIVHRWEGSSHDDWRPWLKVELEKQGYEVLVPDMPDANIPVIETWVAKLAEVAGKPDINTYFIGHSIGCQAILRYLETLDSQVGGAFFVAGWFNLENLEDGDVTAIARPWTDTLIDIVKIKKVLLVSTLYISDNDPYGCFDENKQKFSEIGSKIVVVPGAEHFTQNTLECVLDGIDEIFKPENLMHRFKSEGFAHVFEWHDDPNTVYEEHEHKGRTAFYIVRGSVTFTSGFDKAFKAGERFDVPLGVKHTAIVGPEGCDWIVAEEIEGDS